jgi:hypothetical protein
MPLVFGGRLASNFVHLFSTLLPLQSRIRDEKTLPLCVALADSAEAEIASYMGCPASQVSHVRASENFHSIISSRSFCAVAVFSLKSISQRLRSSFSSFGVSFRRPCVTEAAAIFYWGKQHGYGARRRGRC